MRRRFNPDLLPSKAPEKQRVYKKRIVVNIKSKDIIYFFLRNIKESLHRYNEEEFAQYVGIKTSSIKNYKYGRPPGKDTHWRISKYFARTTGKHYRVILAELEEAYKKARE